MYGIIDGFTLEDGETDVTLPSIMRAEVTNTNDPDQMGKIQIHVVSTYNDRNLKKELNYYTWASYASPFGGMDKISARGPGLDGQTKDDTYGSKSDGGVAYGMWGIPKVGAHVLVCAVDNDPNNLYWFGCIFPDSTPHTMPHGRYSTRTPGGDTGPDGPLNSAEQTIEPLYSNIHKAFRGSKDYEWRTRGADYQVAGITAERQSDEDIVTGTESKKHDTIPQELKEDDGKTLGKDLGYRQGYSLSRSDPTKKTDEQYHIDRYIDTDNNLESTVLSFTTPGFHAFAMDDRPENNRVRLRSSSGHQIIMDDTNERIYISSSEGRNWVEMDSDGHIYIYSQESISIRAEGDLNLTAEKTVRITGTEGVHIQTPNEIRMNADTNIHMHSKIDTFVKTDENLHIHTNKQMFVKTDEDFHLHSDTTLHILTGSDFVNEVGGNFTVKSSNANLDAGGNLDITNTLKTGGNINSGGGLETVSGIKSGGDVASSGGNSLDLHEHTYIPGSGSPTQTSAHVGGSVGGQPASSSPAAWGGTDASDPELAFWTNITPSHEPWARTFTKDAEINLTHTPEFVYDDPVVGRSMKRVTDTERNRGALWHR